MSWFPPVWNLTVYAYVRACLHTQSHRPVSSMNAVVVVVVVVSLDDSSSIYSKSEGYADDFSTKSEHCNRIHVNGIYAQGNSEELFPLAMKKKEMKKWRNEEMKKWRKKKWRKPWHTVENVFVYVQKILQAIIVRTGKASTSLTGQQASKKAGLLVRW